MEDIIKNYAYHPSSNQKKSSLRVFKVKAASILVIVEVEVMMKDKVNEDSSVIVMCTNLLLNHKNSKLKLKNKKQQKLTSAAKDENKILMN